MNLKLRQLFLTVTFLLISTISSFAFIVRCELYGIIRPGCFQVLVMVLDDDNRLLGAGYVYVGDCPTKTSNQIVYNGDTFESQDGSTQDFVNLISQEDVYPLYLDARNGALSGNNRVGSSSNPASEEIITVFPNPVLESKLLNIFISPDFVNPRTGGEFTIYDVNGKVVFHQSQLHDSNISVDIQNFTAGLYFIKMNYSNHPSLLTKFLKN